ncbi:hypothetical protein L7F22_019768 [Adiantum nelumboides]|nr:hypothetical protein [Adiantum nelumboides]
MSSASISSHNTHESRKSRGSSDRSLREIDANTNSKVSRKSKRASTSTEDVQEIIKNLSTRIESNSLLSLQKSLQSNLLQRSTKRRRRSTQSPSRRTNNEDDVGGDAQDNHSFLDPAWESFKQWPIGLEEEERAIGDYFRRLKMIQLEQETRSIFVHDTNDDTQTVYTVSDVRQLETEVRELKTQLQARKHKSKELRKEIERICEQFDNFEGLDSGVREAQTFLNRIQDIELELARLKAVRGIGAEIEKGQNGTIVPSIGTFTQEEAEDVLNEQLIEMESLEMNQSNLLKSIESAKRQLANSLQTVDRLNAEKSAAEKLAREAKAGAEKQRDRKVEAICRDHRARIRLFQGLMGVESIDAPTESSMRILYSVTNKNARQVCEEVAVIVHFDTLGGQMTSFEFETATGRLLTDRIASKSTIIRSSMEDAMNANDVSLFIQAALLCIESMDVND